MKLLLGPAGSGKTAWLLARAHEVMARRGRVWWVGLPQQRASVYRRATEGGAVLGLEVLSSQQLYYRLLAAALRLKPLVTGTARLALVGEALLALEGRLPSPGEAALFTRAIAEAKRYGLSPRRLPSADGEGERLRRVFERYESLKEGRWDYDDFRSEALGLAESKAAPAGLEADLLVVDGYREMNPLELRVYWALAAHRELWLSLPEAPPGGEAYETLRLAATERTRLECYRAPNPVSEARWVLRSLKRDLAQGLNPLDVAVILPEREMRAFAALADEYGVPLMDETPRTLGDTPAGRLLLDLLELPDYPAASTLLMLPELAPLAHAALSRGLGGREALGRLAQELQLRPSWDAWLARLEVPEDEEAWAKGLIDSIAAIAQSPYREALLERAKEAKRLARGAAFRRWWGALLAQTKLYSRPNGGVALLSASLASGRRFKRAYLMHAVKGAYGANEDEDYFIPEELRSRLHTVYDRLGLPKRFLGRDDLFFAELLTRADEQVVSYPEADQGGPLLAEAGLVGAARCLPFTPSGSRLELVSPGVYRASTGPLSLGPVTVEGLRRYSDCGFRFWMEGRLPEESPWWRAFVAELKSVGQLDETRLGVLAQRYPQAGGWLSAHRDRLLSLSYGVRLPRSGFPHVRLDGASRAGGQVCLYHVAAPDSVGSEAEALALLEGRWTEWWAAGYMLTHWQRQVSRVQLTVWPLLGRPFEAFAGDMATLRRRTEACRHKVGEAYGRFSRGDVLANPGFRCRACGVKDVCREAKP